jgi:N-methylhydantoinase A
MADIAIGVDTGGTFTDLVLLDRKSGHRAIHKLPTIPDDPARGILDGVTALLKSAGVAARDVGFFVHGTTLATNAILQRRTAKTGMVTNRGFRDVLEIGRQRRPSFYNLSTPKPVPPVTRDCIVEVAGRLDERGCIVEPLDEDAVRAAGRAFREMGVASVAVCFLHAYANPAHEGRARDILREDWPELYISASAEVLREFREFERFASTAMNASLQPVLDRYLRRLADGLARLGITAPPLVMQSNGGAVSLPTVCAAPIHTFFSGPAGGVVAAARLGREIAIPDMITFDMGGTSSDVSLIRGGKPGKRGLREMAGFPIRIPALDIHTIGAGGGSIAWIDPGGLLKVGPQSAGADPGPALYGRGGTDATVTDANIVLGRLSGRALLGGAMAAFPDLSLAALTRLGEGIGLDAPAAAAGIVEIVNVNMMGAIRTVSVERGEDPRTCALIAFGGAGPLHAVEIARELGIGHVIVPPRPGLLSASGLLDAGRRGDFSVTRLVAAAPQSLAALREGLEILDASGCAWRQAEGLDAKNTKNEWALDLRYLGQAFELTLPLDAARIDAAVLDGLAAQFHQRHESLNGYAMPDHPVEIVTLRLGVVAKNPDPMAEPPARTPAAEAIVSRRPVWFRETGFVDTPIHDRAHLGPGYHFTGPAVIEQSDATTIVPPGAALLVDAARCLRIEVAA